MYYPQNKIKTNLYTEGGEIFSSIGRSYKGYYWKDFKGRFFTGKTPNATPNPTRLFPAPSQPDYQKTNFNPEELKIATHGGIIGRNSSNIRYMSIKGYDPANTKLLIPSTKVFPTEDDYNKGYFNRFFFYKTNTKNFGEMDSKTFKDIKINKQKYPRGLYNIFTLKWLIKGDKEKVANYNTFLVSDIERKLNDTGFAPSLNYNYLEFYQESGNQQSGLYTSGGEFKNRKTGEEYIGFYHIHPEKGPMVGARHVSYQHDFLDPISSVIPDPVSTTPISRRPTQPSTSPTITRPSFGGGGTVGGGGYSGGGGGGGY